MEKLDEKNLYFSYTVWFLRYQQVLYMYRETLKLELKLCNTIHTAVLHITTEPNELNTNKA